MRSDRERLLDIQDAIKQIEKYDENARQRIEQDELIQVWMLYYLRIIGEAVRALSNEFRAQHQEVPWSDIIGMRHVLVHNYFEIDVDVVKRVLEKDLPDLKHKITAILDEMPDES